MFICIVDYLPPGNVCCFQLWTSPISMFRWFIIHQRRTNVHKQQLAKDGICLNKDVVFATPSNLFWSSYVLHPIRIKPRFPSSSLLSNKWTPPQKKTPKRLSFAMSSFRTPEISNGAVAILRKFQRSRLGADGWMDILIRMIPYYRKCLTNIVFLWDMVSIDSISTKKYVCVCISWVHI